MIRIAWAFLHPFRHLSYSNLLIAASRPYITPDVDTDGPASDINHESKREAHAESRAWAGLALHVAQTTVAYRLVPYHNRSPG